ncbi:MAG: hypothetical protein KY476_25220 [Planctomycetes bacterium]|nr:hypothetical protein [Planctomycetota bacterium]
MTDGLCVVEAFALGDIVIPCDAPPDFGRYMTGSGRIPSRSWEILLDNLAEKRINLPVYSMQTRSILTRHQVIVLRQRIEQHQRRWPASWDAGSIAEAYERPPDESLVNGIASLIALLHGLAEHLQSSDEAIALVVRHFDARLMHEIE